MARVSYISVSNGRRQTLDVPGSAAFVQVAHGPSGPKSLTTETIVNGSDTGNSAQLKVMPLLSKERLMR